MSLGLVRLWRQDAISKRRLIDLIFGHFRLARNISPSQSKPVQASPSQSRQFGARGFSTEANKGNEGVRFFVSLVCSVFKKPPTSIAAARFCCFLVFGIFTHLSPSCCGPSPSSSSPVAPGQIRLRRGARGPVGSGDKLSPPRTATPGKPVLACSPPFYILHPAFLILSPSPTQSHLVKPVWG